MIPKKPAIAAMSAVVALAACNDPAQLGSSSGVHRNAAQGALLGGAVGAGLTAVTGGSATNVAAAAAVGAVAGGLIGNRLDKQAADLRGQLASDDITVTNTGDKLVVSLPQDITFDTDSATVRPSLRSDLNKVAGNLLEYPDSSVQVIGHTDNEGSAEYNLGLSQKRSNSVADILQSDGVTYDRLQISGRGEEQPIASNLTPEGRAQNRRVEIVVIPTSS